MDLLSHGLIGAAAAQCAARAPQARIAALAGAAAALLADVDALFRSEHDALAVLEWHRHFTHSLVFIPAGSLVAALVLWPMLRTRLTFQRLYLFTFLGYATAGLLDACTSYGTHLLWPFSDARTAFSIIAIVDPAFTLPVAASVAVATRMRSVAAARAGVAFALAYLALGYVQHQRALDLAAALAAERGLAVERLQVKPTIGNLVLWRAMTVADGRVHADAVRVGFSGGRRWYEGESGELVDPVAELPQGSRAHRDLARFAGFAEGLLVRHPDAPDHYGDARFAMLPTSLMPIWSVRVDPRSPQAPVELVTERRMNAEIRRIFFAMLRGRDD